MVEKKQFNFIQRLKNIQFAADADIYRQKVRLNSDAGLFLTQHLVQKIVCNRFYQFRGFYLCVKFDTVGFIALVPRCNKSFNINKTHKPETYCIRKRTDVNVQPAPCEHIVLLPLNQLANQTPAVKVKTQKNIVISREIP